jgi:hypothetical protein
MGMFNVFVNDGNNEMPSDDILYIICKDKIYLKKKVGFMESIVPVNKISFLSDDIKSQAKMNINRIPSKDFSKIIAFFKKVYKDYNRNEANTVIHFNKKSGKFKTQVPLQKTSSGSVAYINEQIKGYQRIGTIHSHAHMSAFHSATDDSDEVDFDGLHITVGNMNNDFISISCSIVANGTRFTCDPIDYIDGIEFEEFEIPGSVYKKWELVDGKYKQVDDVRASKSSIGYKVKGVIEGEVKFPKKWLTMVDKIKYEEEAKKALPKEKAHDFNPFRIKIPENVNDNGYRTEKTDWNPCEQCPYKEHKTELLMQEIFEGLDEDQLEILGFKEEEENEPGSYNFFDG